MKVLVAGWFSFPEMGATAGDLLARDVVSRVARGPPAARTTWRSRHRSTAASTGWTVDPADYSDVVFVCGPFGNGWPIPEFVERFAGRRLIGVNLSMLDPLDVWNPFDVLLERDSSACVRPDLSLLASADARSGGGNCARARLKRNIGNGLHDSRQRGDRSSRRLTSDGDRSDRHTAGCERHRPANGGRSGVTDCSDGRRRDHTSAWAGAGA